jgi:hypothetical protein
MSDRLLPLADVLGLKKACPTTKQAERIMERCARLHWKKQSAKVRELPYLAFKVGFFIGTVQGPQNYTAELAKEWAKRKEPPL